MKTAQGSNAFRKWHWIIFGICITLVFSLSLKINGFSANPPIIQEPDWPLKVRSWDINKTYPGDTVSLIGEGSGNARIWINGSGEYLLQGFTIDANRSRWFISVGSDHLANIILRKNSFSNIENDELENPAFVFFWDGPQTPINGEEHYKNIVIQENIFHTLRNQHSHGGSITLYDVQDLIYEDNIAYNIDGRGINDKDDGFRNTYRNNLIYDCDIGILLANQDTQGSIDIHHNLIYNCQEAIGIGWQTKETNTAVIIAPNNLRGTAQTTRKLNSNNRFLFVLPIVVILLAAGFVFSQRKSSFKK